MCAFIRAEQIPWTIKATQQSDLVTIHVPLTEIVTHRSPGLNSRENLVFFFLCFLFRLRIDRGMLFFRLVPLCSEAVELAEEVMELVSSVSSAASSSDSSSPSRGHGVCGTVGSCSLSFSSASFGTGPLLLEHRGAAFSPVWSWGASACCSIKNKRKKDWIQKNKKN